MHFFGLLGTILFSTGFLIEVYLSIAKLFYLQYRMTERPMFYLGILFMIIGAQTFLAGFLGELIARNSPYKNQYHISDKI